MRASYVTHSNLVSILPNSEINPASRDWAFIGWIMFEAKSFSYEDHGVSEIKLSVFFYG